MSFGEVAAVVVPLLVPIAAGWLIVRIGLVGRETAHPLTTIYLWVCAPALIIGRLSGVDPFALFDVRFTIGTVVLYVASFAAIFGLFRVILRRAVPVSALGAACGAGFNALSLGLPVLFGIFGPEAIGPVIITSVLFLLVLVPMTLALLAIGSGDDGGGSALRSLRHGLASALRNPIIIAVLIGLGLAVLGVTLPPVVEASSQVLGSAAVLLGLLALGMTVDLDDLRHGGADIYWMSAIRLLLIPAVALVLAILVGVDGYLGAIWVVAFSLPTAKTVFVLGAQYGVYQRESAGIVTLTTILVIVTLPVWLFVTGAIWADAVPR